jgi:CheY-like chemotaxis protein
MVESGKRRTILMADDDAEDCQLVRDALSEAGQSHDLRFVRDGEELFDYLRHCGEYENGSAAPRPDLILLDFKMPRKDGREALSELKADPQLRRIPVFVLTSSETHWHILNEETLFVESYLVKPVDMAQFRRVVKSLRKYLLADVIMPP